MVHRVKPLEGEVVGMGQHLNSSVPAFLWLEGGFEWQFRVGTSILLETGQPNMMNWISELATMRDIFTAALSCPDEALESYRR